MKMPVLANFLNPELRTLNPPVPFVKLRTSDTCCSNAHPPGSRVTQPLPTNGIFAAMMVMNCTLTSRGRLAM
jgi:hypothetical protein